MQQRIVLTGSNGLLGQKIVHLLKDRENIQVIATARGVNRMETREGYMYESLELTEYDKWSELFRTFQPTGLIHAGAMTQVDLCEDQHELSDEVNTKVVKHLSDLCIQYNTHMVHVSTDFVFDGKDGPYVETDVPNPVNYYGQTKLNAEKVLQESSVSAAILRTVLLYGVVPAMSRSNIVLWVKKSLEEERTIQVVNDQFRSPTLVDDLAIACSAALMKKATGIYHISGPEQMSILELAHQVARFWELDESLITETDSQSLNQRAKRPPKTGFILLKAQTELGYQPRTLKEGLAIVDRQLNQLAQSAQKES